jgi:2,3,4,5-tetrahydropyridine-2,6-dicarboxylate N-succinyltransferase
MNGLRKRSLCTSLFKKWKHGNLNFEYHDKMLLKRLCREFVVPNAVARYGAYISSGVILMPSYVNIGAYVDEGTMVDTTL